METNTCTFSFIVIMHLGECLSSLFLIQIHKTCDTLKAMHDIFIIVYPETAVLDNFSPLHTQDEGKHVTPILNSSSSLDPIVLLVTNLDHALVAGVTFLNFYHLPASDFPSLIFITFVFSGCQLGSKKTREVQLRHL